MYINNFKYIMEHKKNVFLECVDMAKTLKGRDKFDIIVHAFTHDLSKFLPCEFKPYAWKFFSRQVSRRLLEMMGLQNKCISQEDIDEGFEKAWKHHYTVNKHHPEHWIGRDMPIKYIRQMVCDLKAMSRKFGGSAQEYYLKNYYKWDITRNTRFQLELKLDLIRSYNAPLCECNYEVYMTIEELIQDSENYLNRFGKIYLDTVKNNINDLLKPACDRFNVDIYELVVNAKKSNMLNNK